MTPPPPVGMTIAATTRSGAVITGKVGRLTPRHVVVGGQQIARRSLTRWRVARIYAVDPA